MESGCLVNEPDANKRQFMQKIPSVTELLASPPLSGLVEKISHNVVVSGVRNFLGEFRDQLQERAGEFAVPTPGQLAERIARHILKREEPALRPVINATGVILHTGLGRSPYAEAALDAMIAAARNYASVELNLQTGQRSQRVACVERLVTELTGAESCLVVNNNAAATVLTLAALAADREVIVSRGQLVEIGGSFRLPDVMAASGATLREVGTTNKTRLSDYEGAISPLTAALMRVHCSKLPHRGIQRTTQPGGHSLLPHISMHCR